jgi:DNA polymerase I-like protein with 3'-5' exonuclease and polymerase domains
MAKAKAPKCVVLDFETVAIEGRPVYPPVPVGVSIKLPGQRKSKYWSWGHPTGNNCDFDEAKRRLREAWARPEPKLFHNAKFDIDVAETHMGAPRLPWEQVHDTMFLLFLVNPHLKDLGLKPAAEALLGLKPDERDAIKEWLVANRLVPKNASNKVVGKMLCMAPGTVVGPYAEGDTDRTEGLFNKLYPEVVERGMLAAYQRELRLLPLLLDNERIGVRVDMGRLEKDLRTVYRPAMGKVEAYILKRLGKKDINLDSNEELADALESAGLAEDFFLTPTGKRSVSAESLEQAIKDTKMFLALGYRSRLQTCTSIFMENWLRIGQANQGFIQPSWHQVRQGGDGKNTGARSGRLITSNPNLLNLSKTFEGRNDGYTHPKFIKLPELPLVRVYMLPDKGHEWGHRDFSQQELRILGHFEDGALLQAYMDNPFLDVHDFVRGKIKELLNMEAARTQVKNINFGTIYGEGAGSLAEKMGVPVTEIRKLKAAQLSVLPGLKELAAGLKQLAKEGKPLTTWGGREYYCEEPKVINGRLQTYEYKMLNYLIQPSAADCTKEAVLRYHEVKKDSRFLVTVYDEINISAPPRAMKREMALLREAMESIEFDIPMLSDGKVGPNWGSLKKYEEPKFNQKKWLAQQGA